MRVPVSTKHRMRLPTAGEGLASKLLEEARENINHHGSEKLSAADMLYLKRMVQRRLGGGAEVGQLKAEGERDQRDDLRRELEEELTQAGLELPHLKKLTIAELENLKRKLVSKRSSGAKKFRSRTSDSTPFFRHFSMPQNYMRIVKTWGSSIILCFLACVFFAIGISLLIASTL